MQSEELIEYLISDEAIYAKHENLIEEYLLNQRENNLLVFRKIDAEYTRLDTQTLGKLLYLPYSLNPELTLQEKKEYARLLNKCFIHFTNKLSNKTDTSGSIWILSVISDVLFHTSFEEFLDHQFMECMDRIFILNTDDYTGEIFILLERMFVIVNGIDTSQAREKLHLFKQHPNKNMIDLIIKKHKA